MAEVYIADAGTKDPDDVRTKNFDAAGVLYDEGNPTVTAYSVFVDATRGSADGALVISNVAWNPTLKRLSYTWSGGTPGQTYVFTARISGVGFSIDQSAKVLIGQR